MLIPLQGNYKTGRQWRIVLSRFFRVKPVIAIYDMQGYSFMKQRDNGFTKCNHFYWLKTVIALTDMGVK